MTEQEIINELEEYLREYRKKYFDKKHELEFFKAQLLKVLIKELERVENIKSYTDYEEAHRLGALQEIKNVIELLNIDIGG